MLRVRMSAKLTLCGVLSEIAGADGDISLIMKASMRWVKTFRAFARGQRVGCDLRHLALSIEGAGDRLRKCVGHEPYTGQTGERGNLPT